MKLRMRKRVRWGRWIFAVLVLAVAGFAVLISRNAACPSPLKVDGEGLMQAIHYRCYGPSTVLQLELAPRPEPDDDMLLVQVRAAAVNPLDWHYMRGEPFSCAWTPAWARSTRASVMARAMEPDQ